jgi:hypothetical protein
MVLMSKIYIGALNIMYTSVHYFYYTHWGSKYNIIRNDDFSVIYALVLSKSNGPNISHPKFRISLPFGTHAKMETSMY